ncbi:hypothetical protein [Chryseobacterium sp. EO14]|uniref:hypothetical protein n=1 Tax=Chryseobacterium sp. EO14 TaxID=2950551 RepID=UPI00210B8BDE|nr:hypothetical protein [Chryseobacterium sp. EO14]MCQ4138799.1 hypothetical protein [Chryseobacterium sp. EO14]
MKKMSVLFTILICMFSFTLQAKTTYPSNNDDLLEILSSKNYSQQKVINYLNKIESDKKTTSYPEICSINEKQRKLDVELDLAFKIYDIYQKELVNITKTYSSSMNVSSMATMAGLKYKRSWCVGGIASWIVCDSNCKPLGGTVWAFCNSYVNSCN